MLRAQASPKTATLLAASAVAVSVTGTVNETALATVTIPAGAMGLNGGVEIRASWSFTNSANNKTQRVRFGGAAGTQYYSTAIASNASVSTLTRIRNRGAANSQVSGTVAGTSSSGLGSVTAALPTSSVDTSASVDVVLSGQLALATETITLESYEVWLLP